MIMKSSPAPTEMSHVGPKNRQFIRLVKTMMY